MNLQVGPLRLNFLRDRMTLQSRAPTLVYYELLYGGT